MKFERKLPTMTNKPNFTFFNTFHKIHNFFTIHHKLIFRKSQTVDDF